MRATHAAVSMILAATLVLGACGDDDPTGPSISAFAGAWSANSIRYTSTANQQRTLDIAAAQVGGGLTMDINNTGGFTGLFTLPVPGVGAVPIPIEGNVALQGATRASVTFDWSNSQLPAPFSPQNPPIANFTADYTLQGNTLTFTRDDAVFHFPGQPAPEQTVLVIAMVRS
jgi:hypothetical protein